MSEATPPTPDSIAQTIDRISPGDSVYVNDRAHPLIVAIEGPGDALFTLLGNGTGYRLREVESTVYLDSYGGTRTAIESLHIAEGDDA